MIDVMLLKTGQPAIRKKRTKNKNRERDAKGLLCWPALWLLMFPLRMTFGAILICKKQICLYAGKLYHEKERKQ